MADIDKVQALLRIMRQGGMGDTAAEIEGVIEDLSKRLAAARGAASTGKIDEVGVSWVRADKVTDALWGPLPLHPDTLRVQRALRIIRLDSTAAARIAGVRNILTEEERWER